MELRRSAMGIHPWHAGAPAIVNSLTVEDVQRCMAPHLRIYAWHKPIYQFVALANLRALWDPAHDRVLDIGGGTGVLAQTVKTLFELPHVVSVDVHDRFSSGLSIETSVYDGVTLPFADNSFDCALLFNVLHHVPTEHRLPLLLECRRVVGRGPLYIKDHISRGVGDDVRLAVLDLLGNAPFQGMITARYLCEADWRSLAQQAGYQAGEPLAGEYRRGIMGALFPNRLEFSARWRPT
jgi:ubiquinone/menaquinone biosynthesis C-methylase UbiE